MISVLWGWLSDKLGGLLPIALAVLAGLALAFGLRRSGERAGRRAAEAERARDRMRQIKEARDVESRVRSGGVAAARERLRRWANPD